MCNFFSFLTDGTKKIYFFSGEQRRNRIAFRDGLAINNYDSHTSIARYYGLREDDWSKAEYNPFTDELVLDHQATTWDEEKVRGLLGTVDWDNLCGDLEGERKFLMELREIPWLKPDGTLEERDDLKLFETREAALNYVKENVTSSISIDRIKNTGWITCFKGNWSAYKTILTVTNLSQVIYETHSRNSFALSAGVDATEDATWYMRAKYVHAGSPRVQKYIDHIQRRMDVWRHGYGVCCDVDGVLYCYKKI